MLHMVNKSPFENRAFDSCISTASAGGCILLIEDGVYAVMQNTAITDKVIKAMQTYTFYVLGPDVQARGLDEAKIIDGIKVVDYGGFVDLVTKNDNVQAWL